MRCESIERDLTQETRVLSARTGIDRRFILASGVADADSLGAVFACVVSLRCLSSAAVAPLLPFAMSAASSSSAAAHVNFPVDLSSEGARVHRQAYLSHTDTAAELDSVNKDSFQSIRLNELRVCFQLSNAKLGLPYVPMECWASSTSTALRWLDFAGRSLRTNSAIAIIACPRW